MSAHTPEQLLSEPQSLVHTPLAHRKPAVQACPQAPQSAAAVLMLVSHPFVAMPSQSPKPAAQVVTRHAPEAQPTTATLGSEQAIPQPPQWELSASVFTSQPLAEERSQSARPELQENPHEAPVQIDDANGGVAQVIPHAPQFDAVLIAVSQPLVGLPSQSRKPGAQMNPQRLSAHAGAAFGRGGQTVAHAPQWLGSVTNDAQAASHAVWPDGQLPMHLPATQNWPSIHLAPHAPQWERSVCKLTHSPSQSTCGIGHVVPTSAMIVSGSSIGDRESIAVSVFTVTSIATSVATSSTTSVATSDTTAEVMSGPVSISAASDDTSAVGASLPASRALQTQAA